jgi:hypothetical protein
MSDIGPWRTFQDCRSMSAFEGKADIAIDVRNVAYLPKQTFCLCAVVGYFNRKSFFL